MSKLKKTLPKNFQEMIDHGNDEAIKAELLKCEVGAYQGSSQNTALFFTGLSREMVEWLLLRGEKINGKNRQGQTPLHAQEFAVEYVRQNPNPIQLEKTDYER